MLMARVVITAVVLEGRSKSVVARDYGVSRRWVQVLAARYLAEGEAAFEPRSRRPHASPRRTSQAVEDAIVALRKDLTEAGHDAGAETIAWHLRQRVRARAVNGDDLADLVPPRVRHPAAAQAAAFLLAPVHWNSSSATPPTA